MRDKIEDYSFDDFPPMDKQTSHTHPTNPIDIDKKEPCAVQFASDETHPWRRFFARTIDIFTWGYWVAAIFPFGFLMIAFQSIRSMHAFVDDHPLLCFCFMILSYTASESLFVSLFGTTPGKSLFGIRIHDRHGHNVNFLTALRRTFLALRVGTAFSTKLDDKLGTVVTHNVWTRFTVYLGLVIVCTSLFLSIWMLLLLVGSPVCNVVIPIIAGLMLLFMLLFIWSKAA